MPDLNLDLRLFQYALASVAHGSFRRAAAALNVQQSTVSRGVRSLEHQVGAKLFERTHAGIRSTAAGDRFLEEALLGFDHLKRAMQRIGALGRGEQGELKIVIAVPISLLDRMFTRFRNRREGVSFDMQENTSTAAWGLVEKRSADVAFLVKAPANGPLRSLHLRNERMAAVLPQSHPLAGARSLSLENLQHERFILGASGLGPDLQEYLAKRMAKWGVEPRVQLHRVGPCNLINMVALGFGVTIVVGHPPRTATDGVVLVPLAGRYALPLHAVWMESNPNPALKALLDIVRATVELGDATPQRRH